MKFCILVLFCYHFSGGSKCTLQKSHPYVRYLTCKIFFSATCTLDEPDKHFTHRLLLYFAFFVKWSDSSPECQKFVEKLFAFFKSKEKATKKPIVSFDRVYQNTSKALGVSYTSVHRIMNGKRPCMSNIPKERSKIVDDFEKSLCY